MLIPNVIRENFLVSLYAHKYLLDERVFHLKEVESLKCLHFTHILSLF